MVLENLAVVCFNRFLALLDVMKGMSSLARNPRNL